MSVLCSLSPTKLRRLIWSLVCSKSRKAWRLFLINHVQWWFFPSKFSKRKRRRKERYFAIAEAVRQNCVTNLKMKVFGKSKVSNQIMNMIWENQKWNQLKKPWIATKLLSRLLTLCLKESFCLSPWSPFLTFQHPPSTRYTKGCWSRRTQRQLKS